VNTATRSAPWCLPRPLIWAATLLCSLAFALPAPAQAATAKTDDKSPAARLTAAIPGLLDEHIVPGLTVCLIDDGAISWTKAFGLRRVRDSLPMSEDTVLEGAELALPMMAHLALELAHEQALDLNQPLGELLPDFGTTDGEAPDNGVGTITTAMLLSQSSGLASQSPDQATAVKTAPGTAFHRSDSGLLLLQRVLEHVGGATLQELLQSRVFAPLGMDNTSMVWRDEFNKTSSAGHDLPSRLPSTVRRKDRPLVASAPSSLHTTAADLARFVIATLGSNGTAGSEGEAVGEETAGSKSAAAAEQRRAALLTAAVTIDENAGLSHGLGWALEGGANGLTAYQWGANPQFRSFVLFHPDTNSGLVVLTNCVAGLHLMSDLTAAYDGQEHPLFGSAWAGSDN